MGVADRCRARTKRGKRCRNAAVEGTTRCRFHSVAVVVHLAESKSAKPTKPVSTGAEEQPGPNEMALIRTLEALGQEEEIEAARNQMLRSLAKGVDLAPTRASLWAEYRQALTDFMKDSDDADDKQLAAGFEALRAAAEVGNS